MRYADSVYRNFPNQSDDLTITRLMSMGVAYNSMGVADTAMLYLDSVISLTGRHNLSDSLWRNSYISAYTRKGSLYYQQGRLSEAIESYFKARTQTSGSRCAATRIVDHYIGLTLYQQRNYASAKAYFENTLRLVDSCVGTNAAGTNKVELLSNIALCYEKLGKLDSARLFYSKALAFLDYQYQKKTLWQADPKNNRDIYMVNKGVILGNIGQVYAKIGQTDTAEALFRESIAINSTYEPERRDAQLNQVHLARLYLDNNQPLLASKVLSSLRKSLDTLKNQKAELSWWQLKCRLAAISGSDSEELYYFKRYTALKDSMAAIENSANASDINTELKSKSQQLEISLLKKGNQLNQLYLWITVTLSVLAILIVGLIYYYYRKGKANIRTLTLLNQDVAEQKGKLEFAMEELRKSNMDKDRILKIVAHDLRNPISGIAQLTRSIMADDMPREDEKQSLNLIERASTNSLNLINEFLELDVSQEKIDLDKQRLDICETVQECVQLLQLSADKKGQKLQLVLNAHPIYVKFNKEKIERVINNLLANAIKFSPRGEKVLIDIAQQEQTVLITITDWGMGIAKDQQEKIFNTFTEARRKGTAGEKSFGLGLSICKQIVEAHSGRIFVESKPSEGSVFGVELPAKIN